MRAHLLAGSRLDKEAEMEQSVSRRGFLSVGAAASFSMLAGCGMLLHPERRNQPSGGSVDWSVFALDTVGLLLFFIPGVIAFAVDFTTGAMYFPPPQYSENARRGSDQQLVSVNVPRQELTQQRVEQVASQQTGREVKLVTGSYWTEPLARLEEFWPTRQRMAAQQG
jgi:hypothetical protein